MLLKSKTRKVKISNKMWNIIIPSRPEEFMFLHYLFSYIMQMAIMEEKLVIVIVNIYENYIHLPIETFTIVPHNNPDIVFIIE